jgi:DNA-binding response OmpR family regulator
MLRLVSEPPLVPSMTSERQTIPSGIAPLDDRIDGLEKGGSYLIVGAPGPEKMVAALQFLHAGTSRGEVCALVTNADAEGILDVASAWGFDMRDAWDDGSLQIVGLKDDFELRAMRSIAPEEVVEELGAVLSPDLDRIAVDPGMMFLSGGAKTLLGSSYMAWARNQTATVLTTFSIDGGAAWLPSSADWLVHATTGRLVLEKRADGLYRLNAVRSVPTRSGSEQTITLELTPGSGLIEPQSFPARRGSDRAGVDENRLLLLSLEGQGGGDLEAWATQSFEADVVTEPFEAVAAVQSETKFGGVLIHTPGRRSPDAIRACRAIRPLTRAAIILASDDAVRASDRIQVLEAGADDFLSGGIDLRELGVRIRQAIARGAAPVVTGGSTPSLGVRASNGGRVSMDTFREEINTRAKSVDSAFFCVLAVDSTELDPEELREGLSGLIRTEHGDVVSGTDEQGLVLLQGARVSQLGPFLGRLRNRLDERVDSGDAGISVEVLSHPVDSDRIAEILVPGDEQEG